MKTLVIYDNEGYIISQMIGTLLREPVGIPFLWVEVPSDKYLISIDVSDTIHIPVYGDLPINELTLLKQRVDDLEEAVADLIGGA